MSADIKQLSAPLQGCPQGWPVLPLLSSPQTNQLFLNSATQGQSFLKGISLDSKTEGESRVLALSSCLSFPRCQSRELRWGSSWVGILLLLSICGSLEASLKLGVTVLAMSKKRGDQEGLLIFPSARPNWHLKRCKSSHNSPHLTQGTDRVAFCASR